MSCTQKKGKKNPTKKEKDKKKCCHYISVYPLRGIDKQMKKDEGKMSFGYKLI